jgi:hypothetical protein
MGTVLGLTSDSMRDVVTVPAFANAPKLFDAVFAVEEQYPPPPHTRSLNTTDL